MRTNSGWAVAAALVLLLAGAEGRARACGVCVEDRVAAVYDHAMVSAAHRRGWPVAFVALAGPRAGDASRLQRVRRALAACPGVEVAAPRAVPAAGPLAFAWDPARVTLADALARARRALGPGAVTLDTLKVLRAPPRVAREGRADHLGRPTRPSRSGQVARLPTR
jgi:hypothetical protein